MSTSPQAASRSRRILRRIGRGLKWLGIGLVALAFIGALYQVIAAESDRRAYPAPHPRVDVDGHAMYIDCVGTGSPTVILEAAAGHMSVTWAWVQPQVAASTRVCAYDRAGYGWSDSGPEPRDARQQAEELYRLLDKAGVEGPYVLVAHSIGAYIARVFAGEHPREVAGMVLVDASHPEQWARQPGTLQSTQAVGSVLPFLARIGVMRLLIASQPIDLPPRQRAELAAFMSSSEYWDAQRADSAWIEESVNQVNSAGPLRESTPLAVVTAGEHVRLSPAWSALQADLAALSSNSIHYTVDGATHISLVTAPPYAQEVGAAIVQVVEAARTGRPLRLQTQPETSEVSRSASEV